MVKRAAKLRTVLARRQGRDFDKEKQKKLRKQAEKVKRRKLETAQDDDESDGEGFESEEEDGEGAASAALLIPDAEPLSELEIQHAALSRLADSESDSDSSDEALEENEQDLATIPKPKTLAEQLASLVGANGSADKVEAAANGENGVEEEDDDEEDEEEHDNASQASSIALSELENGSQDEGDADIIPHQRLTINNTAALIKSLASFTLPYAQLPFSEHQSITTAQPVVIEDVNDDLNRELEFYKQSLSAVKEARALLKKENIPFTRPADYFAEMVKSDEHMGRIKEKLVSEAASKRAAQEARKQRDLRKFGKQVQQEKLKERAKAKKDMLEKVNVLKRKRQGAGLDRDNEEDMFDVALEDAAETDRKERQERHARSGQNGSRKAAGPQNAKRQRKDSKFGFGGKKRFSKSNDAQSSSEMSGYSVKKMKGSAAKQRPGKNRRAKAR